MFLASGPFFVAVYDERKSDEPVHRKSPKTTIDKSKRRGYDCVTRLRTFLKFTGISSQDPKRVLQQEKRRSAALMGEVYDMLHDQN